MSGARRSLVFGPASRSRNSLSSSLAASGVGFWLVFGHAGPRPRVEVEPPSQSTDLVPVDPPQKLIPIDEKPADIVERFFLAVVRPALNRRVRSLVMWEAFRQWCADRSIDIAVSHAMFGGLARWHKGRIGGAVWYPDCELAEGYAIPEPKALPRPRAIIAEGSQGGGAYLPTQRRPDPAASTTS